MITQCNKITDDELTCDLFKECYTSDDDSCETFTEDFTSNYGSSYGSQYMVDDMFITDEEIYNSMSKRDVIDPNEAIYPEENNRILDLMSNRFLNARILYDEIEQLDNRIRHECYEYNTHAELPHEMTFGMNGFFIHAFICTIGIYMNKTSCIVHRMVHMDTSRMRKSEKYRFMLNFCGYPDSSYERININRMKAKISSYLNSISYDPFAQLTTEITLSY